MSSFVVLDVETNGLPRTPRFGAWYAPSELSCYETARVLQIAIVSATENRVWWIRPDGFPVENSDFHGITMDKLNACGQSFQSASEELMECLSHYDLVVGHNTQFDLHVIASEMHRYSQIALATRLQEMPYACTMLEGRAYMKQYRVPKLVALYKFISGEDVQQTHDALDDCYLAYKCYAHIHGVVKKAHGEIEKVSDEIVQVQ